MRKKKRGVLMLKLENAIQRCFDRCNLDLERDGDCIYKYMYQYKAIADLPDVEFEKVYDSLSEWLGLTRPAR